MSEYLTPRQRRLQASQGTSQATPQAAEQTTTEYMTPRQRREASAKGASPVPPAKVIAAVKKPADITPKAFQAVSAAYNSPSAVASRAKSNPVVGENAFLTNTFPINKLDSPIIKGAKTVGNVGASLLSSLGEGMRQNSIQLSNQAGKTLETPSKAVSKYSSLTANNLKNIPKNTTLIDNILPEAAGKAINKFAEEHPVIGGVAKMGIEGGGDPLNMFGFGGAKAIKNTTEGLIQTGNANKAILAKLEPKPLKTVAKDTVNTVYDENLPPPSSKIVSSTKKEPFSLYNIGHKFYNRVIDANNPIKKADEASYRLASNSKNVSGIVDHNLTQAMVDRQGNKIGNSLKQEVEAIPKSKENVFWEYMMHRNNIDRAREGKPVYPEYTPDMSTEAAKRFEIANPEFKQTGDNITNWLDKFTRTWGVDTGIINKDLYDNLRQTYKSYVPTNRDFSMLEDAIPQSIKSKFVDQHTPIMKATGSSKDIRNPVENIMNLVNRTIRTAKYNEVGQTLLNSVRTAPEKLKSFAEVIPEGQINKNVDNVVTIMENGKPTYLQINNKELLDSLNNTAKNINNFKAVRAVTNVYKGLITQKNPLFAIRNIFRDIPTAYIYGSEKNPFKFAAGLSKAGKDIATNSENFQRYKAVGGGGANFFKSGNVAKSAKDLTSGITVKKVISSPIKAIEKFNNITETAPRLAEFNRVLDKTGDIDKALFAANDVTVNFSRGGNITKSVDTFVPYLNAGVQGLDKFFRGFKNPKTAIATIIKSGVAISTPEIALYLINKDNPNYKILDNRTKDTYYLIPTPDKKFIKIPKSRELGVLFGSLLSRIVRQAKGEKNAFKGYGNALGTSFAPTNPFENNIISPAVQNLATNKDFAGRAIVPQSMIQDKRSGYLQYDEKTSEIAKWIGNLTKDINGGLSPKQIDYLVRSYTGVIGQMGLPVAVKGSNITKSVTTQFVSDPLYSNQTITDFYDNYNNLQRKATDRNITGNIPSKILTKEETIKNKFAKASSDISDINKEIRKLNQVKDITEIRKLRKQILDIAKNTNDMLK